MHLPTKDELAAAHRARIDNLCNSLELAGKRIAELESKLQACEKQRDEWKAYADAGLQNSVSLQAEVASYASRLSSALEERDVLKAGQAAAQATHGRMLAQAADADEKINGLESRLSAGLKLLDDWRTAWDSAKHVDIPDGVEQIRAALQGPVVERGSSIAGGSPELCERPVSDGFVQIGYCTKVAGHDDQCEIV